LTRRARPSSRKASRLALGEILTWMCGDIVVKSTIRPFCAYLTGFQALYMLRARIFDIYAWVMLDIGQMNKKSSLENV